MELQLEIGYMEWLYRWNIMVGYMDRVSSSHFTASGQTPGHETQIRHCRGSYRYQRC